MKRLASARTGNMGVNLAERAVIDKLDWLFREQPKDDYGIDAHIEVVDDDSVTGLLLALQIKAGDQFDEKASDGWWFRPKAAHVDYWLNHSLPVVVVLADTDGTGRCYWQVVSRKTVEKGPRGGLRILVPETQVLDESAAGALREIAQGDPYLLKLRELQLARPWMDILASGQRLLIEVEEWINKSSGRGSITLKLDNEGHEPPKEVATWWIMLGGLSYTEVVPKLFAWADVVLHAETYDDADHDAYEVECVRYDEGDRIVLESFEDWQSRQNADPLRPYANVMNEVDKYRWELVLNDLGRGFLAFDRFAAEGVPLLTSHLIDE
ncbi:DUF4365 domain-containing protein [Nocardia brasiliensis]|uniref:DUF4365 domain-containing protein n=1 Tax=Nocardia brasiliensis TaxID=37326 RepID=UPI0018945EFC|nr:DUF4365 domain-containing protein [Nocardia brasiliensis]MBF6546965.1 DUF4365 domain-containing protein [Nocardia brasiliensis]